MKLKATVYSDRRYLGTLEVSDTGTFDLVALSDPELKVPNPTPGHYRFTRIVEVSHHDADAQAAYGAHIIFFERLGPWSGTSDHKADVLALHGGYIDDTCMMFPTEGSLRVSDLNLMSIVDALCGSTDATLEIEEKKLGFMAKFTQAKVSRGSARRIRYRTVVTTSDDDDGPGIFYWLWAYTMLADDGTPYDDTQPFTGSGGEMGGAGATGGWTVEPADTLPRGDEVAVGGDSRVVVVESDKDEAVPTREAVSDREESHQANETTETDYSSGSSSGDSGGSSE